MNMRSALRLTAAACGLAVATSAAVLGPRAARADVAGESRAVGQWAFQLSVKAAEAPEENIGTFALRPDGRCTLGTRSNFAGAAHDHEATTCTWRSRSAAGGERAALDGSITVTGVAAPGPTVISFVLGQRSQQMLLMLDDTSAGVVGTGKAYRR